MNCPVEIQLIEQIERIEYLYNTTLPEYNRKDLVDEAWANISASINLPVTECREKWRNIRSSYLRSLRPKGSKVKKPYYLKEYLKFIVPFLKPLHNYEYPEDFQSETSMNIDDQNGEVHISYLKPEFVEIDEQENYDSIIENGISNDSENVINVNAKQPVTLRKKRRYISDNRNVEAMKNRKILPKIQRNRITNDCNYNSNNDSINKMFLLSLLPELETMTDDQVRLFKIKSMMLIDDIKLNYPQIRENNNAIGTERLQKKLINLLLRNLKHKSS